MARRRARWRARQADVDPRRLVFIDETWAKTNMARHDYVRITPIPDAETALDLIAGWFGDYNDNHPHSGLRMRSPREFRRAL